MIIWDPKTNTEILRDGFESMVTALAFHPKTDILICGRYDGVVEYWDIASDNHKSIARMKGFITALTFDATGEFLAIASSEGGVTVRRLNDPTAVQLRSGRVYSLAFHPSNGRLVTGGNGVLHVWDGRSGKLEFSLEGHTAETVCVSFSSDGRILATKESSNQTPDASSQTTLSHIRLYRCDTWDPLAVLEEPFDTAWQAGLAFSPSGSLLASTASSLPRGSDTLLHIRELNVDLLLKQSTNLGKLGSVHHTTARIVVVGDSGVGKSGLGWRLAHREFKEHASTHGQQFWVVDQLALTRPDGTNCEAILWDLAGQPDYRLTHALFLDDADLALILFDAANHQDPLKGVEFWLRHLQFGLGQNKKPCPTILIGARIDRGSPTLTDEELESFCRERAISGGYLATSAYSGEGLEELLRRMKSQILWNEKPATVTTKTFKRIKDHVLKLKETREGVDYILSAEELRTHLERQTILKWDFSDAEMMTAVAHLENYGYVKRLRASTGEQRILLAPDLLNNLAASFVLEARRNPKGLGALEEHRLLTGDYRFQEVEKVSKSERDILIDSAALLFLEHNVCFRETDPLRRESYLVFPDLINLKKPPLDNEAPTEDGLSYIISGAVENVYASLVVLLGYTTQFTRTNQWHNRARYEVGGDLVCGFRREADHEGELECVLYFGINVGRPVRTLFQGLFESFLARRNLTVHRYQPVGCARGHLLNRTVVREHLQRSEPEAFCSRCGDRILLPAMEDALQLTKGEQLQVDAQRRTAEMRTRFEQAVFRVQGYVKEQKMKVPSCFISYAWGVAEHERWVERNLASDLAKAGVNVLLDRWENARIGVSIMRFIERIHECDNVVVVGTPAYARKYQNAQSGKGFVVAAEGDLMAPRMLDGESKKESILPILLSGEPKDALPPWLHGRVYADFRDTGSYFLAAFDLILAVYHIPPHYAAVADIRESLRST